MLKREWGAESKGKLLHLSIPGKTAALVSEFVVEDLLSAELQPRFLGPVLGQSNLMNDDMSKSLTFV